MRTFFISLVIIFILMSTFYNFATQKTKGELAEDMARKLFLNACAGDTTTYSPYLTIIDSIYSTIFFDEKVRESAIEILKIRESNDSSSSALIKEKHYAHLIKEAFENAKKSTFIGYSVHHQFNVVDTAGVERDSWMRFFVDEDFEHLLYNKVISQYHTEYRDVMEVLKEVTGSETLIKE